MKRLLIILLLAAPFSSTALADVWRWVDAQGNTHYVDTDTAIYTWVDDFGKVHYSDTPDHEDAVAVQLVWHSPGRLSEAAKSSSDGEESELAYADETPEERAAREQAEAYYCERATEIYESYLNAPQLYRTNEQGEREYLSKDDAAKTIAETKARKDELCQ